MNKDEFNEEIGHRYARCDRPMEHNAHAWSMRRDPFARLWWCEGSRSRSPESLTKEEFIKKYGMRHSMCGMREKHPAHNWKSLALGHCWCSETLPAGWADGNVSLASLDKYLDVAKSATKQLQDEADIPEDIRETFKGITSAEWEKRRPLPVYDQTIRPLPCSWDHIHSPHVWTEIPGGFAWSCPGSSLDSFTAGQHNDRIADEHEDRMNDNKSNDDDQRRIEAYQNAARQAAESDVEDINWLAGGPGRDPYMPGKPKHDDCAICGTGNTDSHMDHAKPTTEIARWADTAMFKAEPVDTSGPKVYLLWMTPDPLGAIAAACKMYKGEVVRDLSTVTDEERLDYLAQIQKTKLKAPFEFVKFHFMIEGVTRAFTHQMVRQRTAVYAQESMRFAVKEDMPVGLPPSIQEGTAAAGVWQHAVDEIGMTYQALVDSGIPAEDARGLLPTNILTRLHYSTDLRALLDHAGNRLCTQAQAEWRLVFAKIVEAIREKAINPEMGYGASDANGTTRVYMAKELAGLFKPVCYQTGKCEFKANFDRYCSIRERVDANERIGRPSSEWGNTVDLGMPNPVRDPHNPAHEFPWLSEDGHTIIPDIKPGEWLLDPGAAREKK